MQYYSYMKDASLADSRLVDAVIGLGELALAFGRILRITAHPDGKTLESDTDHTVMLGLIACAYAAATSPELDLGKVAQYALVHDLVEVYAGDTPTFGMHFDTPNLDKKEREQAALARIEKEFGDTLPWLAATLHEYESLASPEARYVKTLDKAMPKIANVLNRGATIPDPKEFVPFTTRQLAHLEESYGSDQPQALALYAALVKKVKDILPKEAN